MGHSQFEQGLHFKPRGKAAEVETGSNLVSIEIFYQAVAFTSTERTMGETITVEFLLVLLVLLGGTAQAFFHFIQ